MPTHEEPEDVDFIVSSGPADPDTAREVAEFIAAYRRRPEYAEESRRAHEILARLGIHPEDNGVADPGDLLEHWRRCVQDLTGHRPGEANGKPGGADGPEGR
jgi:hypothetical protein